MASEITRAMRDAAYEASAALAQEKGRFPLFDADKLLAAPHCASRLPPEVQQQIRAHGLRNSHLLSIAPTGTISLAFAANASGGIEPTFSWTYTRKKRMPDGSKQEYLVEDYAYRLWQRMGGDTQHLPPVVRPRARDERGRSHADDRRGAAVHRRRGQQDRQRARGLPVRGLPQPVPRRLEGGPQGHHHLPAQQRDRLGARCEAGSPARPRRRRRRT